MPTTARAAIAFLGVALCGCGSREEVQPRWFTSWVQDDRIHLIVGRERLIEHTVAGPCGFKTYHESKQSDLCVLSWPLSAGGLPTIEKIGVDKHSSEEMYEYPSYVSLDGSGVWKDLTNDVSEHRDFSWQHKYLRPGRTEPEITVDGVVATSPNHRRGVAVFRGPTPRLTVVDLHSGNQVDISARLPADALTDVGVRRLVPAVDDGGLLVCLYRDDLRHDGDVLVIPTAGEAAAFHCNIAISPGSSFMAVASSPDGPLLLTGQNDKLPTGVWDMPYVAIVDARGRLVARAPSLPAEKGRCIMNSSFQACCWDAANRRIVLPPASINYMQMPADQVLRVWHYDTGTVDEVHLQVPPEWQNSYATGMK